MEVAVRTLVRRNAVGALLVAQITMSRLALLHPRDLCATQDDPVCRRHLVGEHWRPVHRAVTPPLKALVAERMEAGRELGHARAEARERLLAHCTLRPVLVLAGEGIGQFPLRLWRPARPIPAC